MNSLSKLSYGRVSDNFTFFNICKCRKVFQIATITIAKHINKYLKSYIIEYSIQKA